jgi:hypothetical protein
MKLLVCKECSDIFNLTFKPKCCGCGKSEGRYLDELNAEISGPCQPIGFSNSSIRQAAKMQWMEDEAQKGKPVCCDGVRFEAFFIPASATSIKRTEK